ncbi:MAG: tRNA glutamyl-Q(34) synthetase GluQRS [Methylotenera sp.]|nr:tRNA glutamyl-Q(34) synthetase GluQRS [Methylotenera sp.]
MYIGRFAPSPTGPLHFGSLITAVASYCDAKANHGKWLVRIEDLDLPRTIKGAADTILRQLEAFGLVWDDKVVYQSQRHAYYEQALQQLQTQHLIYPCTCTRKEVADASDQRGVDGIIYPRTCLNHPLKSNAPQAWRVKTEQEVIQFKDLVQGHIQQNIGLEVGDFILKRADNLFSYQLAVVVDDALQGVTHIVRGADLLDSTPRQMYLQHALQYTVPHYAHIPIATNSKGEKLSKQTHAKPIEAQYANDLLYDALSFLQQHPPVALKIAPINEILHWATCYWHLNQVRHQQAICYQM